MLHPRLLRAGSAVALLAWSCKADVPPLGPATARVPSGAPTASVAAPWPVPRRPLAFSPTDALIQRAELRAKVEALAELTVLSGPTDGRAHTPSPDYARFAAVKALATEAELGALLLHERPVVRAYVARDLAGAAPRAVAEVARLLADDAPVKVAAGCEIAGGPMREVVRTALCGSPHAAAGDALLADAAAHPEHADASLACASRTRPDAAAAAAASLLAGDVADPRRAALLEVLAEGPSVPRCALARGSAKSASEEVRRSAARALARCSDSDSVATLEALTVDGEGPRPGDAAGADVVRAAQASLVLNPGVATARRKALAETLPWASSDAAERLAARARALAHADPDLLARVEAMSLFLPAELGPAVAALHDSDESLALARRLLLQLPVPNGTFYRSVRAAALKRLARAKAPSDLPELRRALVGADVVELETALGALAAAGDVASVPAVEKLTRSDQDRVKAAAKAALASLRVTRAR